MASKLIYSLLLILIGALNLNAKEQSDSLSTSPHGQLKGKFMPRSAFLGVEAIDTISTQSPGVKIIVYANNTWNYFRDMNDSLVRSIFDEYWQSEWASSYKNDSIPLPDKVKLWIVDNEEDFTCPHVNKVYSPYGFRHGHRHTGVDIPLARGTKVYAAFAGKVRLSKYMKGYGNIVIIRHLNGLETFYAHLSKRLVNVGDWLESGQCVGLGGSTGRSTGPHLHFETRYRGYAFDPQWLIDFEKGRLRSSLFILKKKYLNAYSRYIPDTYEAELGIHRGDSLLYYKVRQQEIRDSLAAVEAAKAKYHKVRSGDSLYWIAKKYSTSVGSICKLNKGLSPKTPLKIGRLIRVK